MEANGRSKISRPHSDYCHPDEQAEFEAIFKQALKDSLSTHWYKLKELYDGLALVHPEAAATLSFQNLHGFMKRIRKRIFPPQPRTLAEFAERANDPAHARNLEYGSGRLSVQLITDPAAHNHLLLYDAQFVQDEMAYADRLFIDGTFQCAPQLQDVYQLVTIMAIKFGHGIPFAWILMSTKTQVAYETVFRHVKRNLLPRANVRLVMSDFEAALRNAIVRVHPTAHSTGCNAHFDRAIYRQAKKLRLAPLIRAEEDVRRFLKKLLALAYLPAGQIQAEFDNLEDELPQNRQRQLQFLLAYFRRYWLGVVKPHGFSVWGLGRRTNNISESYNSKLALRLGVNPSPWDFLCKLLTLQHHAKVDVGHLRNNRRVSRHARYSSVYKQKTLQRAWRDLYMQVITTREFLEKAAALKGNIVYPLNAEPILYRMERDYDVDRTPAVRALDADPDYDPRIFAEDPPQWILIDNAPRDAPVNGAHADNAADGPHQLDSDEDDDVVAEAVYSSDSSDEEYEALDHVNGDGNQYNNRQYDSEDDPEEAHVPDPADDVDPLPEAVEPQLEVERNGDPADDGDPLPQPDSSREMTPPPEPNAHRRVRKRVKKRKATEQSAGLSSGLTVHHNQDAAPVSQQKHRNKRRGDAKRKANEAKLQQQVEAALVESARTKAEAERLQGIVTATQAELAALKENGVNKCGVCLETNVLLSLVPCGHTFCGDCLKVLTNNLCPICKGRRTGPPIRIFLQ